MYILETDRKPTIAEEDEKEESEGNKHDKND